MLWSAYITAGLPAQLSDSQRLHALSRYLSPTPQRTSHPAHLDYDCCARVQQGQGLVRAEVALLIGCILYSLVYSILEISQVPIFPNKTDTELGLPEIAAEKVTKAPIIHDLPK